MATVVVCDRCKKPGKCTTILGRDVCSSCVLQLRLWLDTPPYERGGTRHAAMSSLLQQALSMAASQGYASCEQLMQISGDRSRRIYHALRYLGQKGLLVPCGKGIYREPARRLKAVSE